MTETAHTPLPWTAERDLPHNRMPRVHSSADGSLICECGNMGTTQKQWEANAAFIVHAVNSHHDLIEALRWYADQFCELGTGHECCGRLTPDECSGCKARAILTKAEAGHG